MTHLRQPATKVEDVLPQGKEAHPITSVVGAAESNQGPVKSGYLLSDVRDFMVICSEGREYRLSDVRDFMVICSEGRGYRLN